MDNSPQASWDVVVTAKAPRSYVSMFVDLYRQLGAARIHIYYDDPLVAYDFSAADVVETVCDSIYWQGRRPRAIEKRQMLNATRAALASSADWILHCDIDEHIHSVRQVSSVLADVPEDHGCVLARPVEAVYVRRPVNEREIFQTSYFKSIRAQWNASSRFWSDVYVDISGVARAGFWGHRVGKSFIRTGRLADIGLMPIHLPSGEAFSRINHIKSKEIFLRHYDALLPEEWMQKHLNRVNGQVIAKWAGEQRNMQSKLVSDAFERAGLDGVLSLYDRMYVINADELRRGLETHVITVIEPSLAAQAGER
jgi:hypothetical protein